MADDEVEGPNPQPSEPKGAEEGAPPQRGGAPEVIPAVYDFILWMAPKVAKYPKVHRFTLGDRTMTVLLEVLDGLIVARYERAGRIPALHGVNRGLERLRYLVRLARDLRCLSISEYEFAARHIVDTGRRVGGWIRHARGRTGG